MNAAAALGSCAGGHVDRGLRPPDTVRGRPAAGVQPAGTWVLLRRPVPAAGTVPRVISLFC
jgi:hypothetical protein